MSAENEKPAYRDCTYGSGFYPLRWLHEERFRLAFDFLKLREMDSLLDYGCGDAQFLKLCLNRVAASNLFGYEPAQSMRSEAMANLGDSGITVYGDLLQINRRFSKIVCMETCEHLSVKLLERLFTSIDGLVEREGMVLISVPIETGLFSVFKNAYRYILGRKYHSLSLMKIFKAAFGIPIEREAEKKLSGVDFIYSHVGFSHHTFQRLLEKFFIIEEKHYSPLNILGPVFNNTVYFVCRKKRPDGDISRPHSPT
jgi:cyclopropane fatty-acyl-phospholipid synthase-like methyltransferase